MKFYPQQNNRIGGTRRQGNAIHPLLHLPIANFHLVWTGVDVVLIVETAVLIVETVMIVLEIDPEIVVLIRGI